MKYRDIFRFSCMFFVLLFFILSVADGRNAVEENVFSDPESLVRELYATVTFDPGNVPDWDYVRKFFTPEAAIAVRMTRTSMAVLNVDEFLKWFDDDVKKYKMNERGFEESIEKLKLTVFGDMAHCFVVYKASFKTPENSPSQLGLDSWGLMKKDGRWWIVSVTNDVVTPQTPLPEELRK
ncbi:MAG: hypothetical protein WBF32_01705 [Candidatus Aminicenantaceae bacterium]